MSLLLKGDAKKATTPEKKSTTKASVKKKSTAALKKKPPIKVKGAAKKDDDDDDTDASDDDGGGDQRVALTSQEVANRFRKLTDAEHVLKRPDTFTGSIVFETDHMWVVQDLPCSPAHSATRGFDGEGGVNEAEKEEEEEEEGEDGEAEQGVKKKKSPHKKPTVRMVYQEVTIVPALIKIFDEILVNAGDNRQRDASTTTVKIDIDRSSGQISIWNNGRGLPVTMHSHEKLYVPTLVFGEMRTSSNFDDDEKRTTGGRNGYGAKLCNIFSREFVVQTQDQSNGLSFYQRWTQNMSKREEPRIRNCSKSDFTCVTFTPDYARFGLRGLDDDHMALFKKRAYDLAGTYAKLRVFLNGTRIEMKRGFQDYVSLYIGSEASCVYESVNAGCQICVAESLDEGAGFQHMSFVNGICTTKGGRHVDVVLDQVAPPIVEAIKKKKTAADMRVVKSHLFVFVNVLVINPAFDSQTKTTLMTKKSEFASDMKLSDKFLKRLVKSPITATILEAAQWKHSRVLNKSDGKKTGSVKVPKLEDATCAGLKNSSECTLILTEGDSAKALAMAGVSVVGRKTYGVFPLKGKIVNVRDSLIATIEKNTEFANIKKILGLKNGVQYEDASQLRYGTYPI
jgi:DNA topoisomerase-2